MPTDQENHSNPDPMALTLADMMGRILALQTLVTRLLASHADRFPDGFASHMLQNIDDVVGSVDSTMKDGYVRDAIQIYLRDYLEKAQSALDSERE